jgi:hypothetical protein
MGSDGLWRNQANTPPNPCTGVINKRVQRIWSSKLPMKLKSSYGRSVVTSSKLGWNWKREIGNTATFVGFCGCPETVEHICFTCVLAKFTWVYFKEALGWERVLRNLQDFPYTLGFRWDVKIIIIEFFSLAIVLWGCGQNAQQMCY